MKGAKHEWKVFIYFIYIVSLRDGKICSGCSVCAGPGMMYVIGMAIQYITPVIFHCIGCGKWSDKYWAQIPLATHS